MLGGTGPEDSVFRLLEAWEKHPVLRFSVPWDCQFEVEEVNLAASNSYFFLGGGGADFIAFTGLGEIECPRFSGHFRAMFGFHVDQSYCD